jgi:hypothetical protein
VARRRATDPAVVVDDSREAVWRLLWIGWWARLVASPDGPPEHLRPRLAAEFERLGGDRPAAAAEARAV